MGLRQIGGTDGLKDIVLEILKEYPNQLAELIDGKQKVLGFLVGQVMKKTNGAANPKEVNEIIQDEIKKEWGYISSLKKDINVMKLKGRNRGSKNGS